MGKASLIAVAAVIAVTALYNFATQQGVYASHERVAEHQHTVLARNAAITGFNRAKQDLASSFVQTALLGKYSEANYEVEVDLISLSRARVRSTGKSLMGNGSLHTVVITAEIDREIDAEIHEDPPLFMQFAIISEASLTVHGNATVDILITGEETNLLNAAMHTNGNLHAQGNVLVRGFGTFAGSYSQTGNKEYFQPNYNPTNAPVVQKVAPIEIPMLSVAELAQNIIPHQASGNLILNTGTIEGGPREDPFVWHVGGNLTISGDVKINGYIMFLVEGNVEVAGSAKVGQSGHNGPDESSMAIYTDGNLKLNGNSETWAQLYVGGMTAFENGTMDIYGNMAMQGGASFGGTPRIHYRKASPALTTVFEDQEVWLRLISYSEK
jgi:hypothetical protein